MRQFEPSGVTYVCNLPHRQPTLFACSTMSAMRDHLWLSHEIRRHDSGGDELTRRHQPRLAS